MRGRFPWLLANLMTALLASWVIRQFEGSLQKMVALAVLMPIVASMGGNAGTQTMTVAVRALATRDLSRANAWRVIRRELAVGLLNGIAFALIMGMVAAAWFNINDLGLDDRAGDGVRARRRGARRDPDSAAAHAAWR